MGLTRRLVSRVSIVSLVLAIVAIAGLVVEATGAWFTDTKGATLGVTAGEIAFGSFGTGPDGIVEITNVKPMTEAEALDPENSFGAGTGTVTFHNTGDVAVQFDATMGNLVTDIYLWPDELYLAVKTGDDWEVLDASTLFAVDDTPPVTVTLVEDGRLASGESVEVEVRAFLRSDFEPTFGDWALAWQPTFDVSLSAVQQASVD